MTAKEVLSHGRCTSPRATTKWQKGTRYAVKIAGRTPVKTCLAGYRWQPHKEGKMNVYERIDVVEKVLRELIPGRLEAVAAGLRPEFLRRRVAAGQVPVWNGCLVNNPLFNGGPGEPHGIWEGGLFLGDEEISPEEARSLGFREKSSFVSPGSEWV